MAIAPGSIHAAQNARSALLVGTDTLNGIQRQVKVLPDGTLCTTGAAVGVTQDVDIVAQSGGPLIVTPPTSGTGTFSTVAIGAVAVSVLAANPSRVGAAITNNGNTDMYLGFAATVTVGTAPGTGGNLLVAEGGSWEPKGYTGPVYLISSGAGTVAGVQEW